MHSITADGRKIVGYFIKGERQGSIKTYNAGKWQ